MHVDQAVVSDSEAVEPRGGTSSYRWGLISGLSEVMVREEPVFYRGTRAAWGTRGAFSGAISAVFRLGRLQPRKRSPCGYAVGAGAREIERFLPSS